MGKLLKLKMAVAVGLLFAIVSGVAEAGISQRTSCHPTVSLQQKNFMIGYGSLMQDASRQRTTPKATHVYPIEIKGFERVWGIHGGHYKTTFLTLVAKKASSLNAVYYPVTRSEINATDKREVGYCRIQISRKHLMPLGLKTLPEGVFWVYTKKSKAIQLPTKEYPIAQSYVDVFMGGCFQVQRRYQIKNFASQCIVSTKGWSSNEKGLWVNDRHHPRRPFAIPDAIEIDKLLRKHFKHYDSHPFD